MINTCMLQCYSKAGGRGPWWQPSVEFQVSGDTNKESNMISTCILQCYSKAGGGGRGPWWRPSVEFQVSGDTNKKTI